MPGTPVDLSCKSPDFKEKSGGGDKTGNENSTSQNQSKTENSRSSSSSLNSKSRSEKPAKPEKPEKPSKPVKMSKKIVEEADKIDVEDMRSESRCQNDPFGVLPDGTGKIERHELVPTPQARRKIVQPLPVPTIHDLDIDELTCSESITSINTFDAPSACSLPRTRLNSTSSEESPEKYFETQSNNSIEHAPSNHSRHSISAPHSEDEIVNELENTSTSLKASKTTLPPTPMLKKRRESAPESQIHQQLPVEIKCKSMLGHQARCNSLIAEVQSKHKSLYTNHRRLEEDITKMMGGDEFEHCKTIPCKQIRQTFDAADLELEALREKVVEINGANRRKARQFADKLTQASLSKKFSQRSQRLDELQKQAAEQLEWMKSMSLDSEIDAIVDQLQNVQSEIVEKTN